nr:hypothetical protein [Tanacetum cinerariifolium]
LAPHSVGEEARLEKLKYVAKGEPKGYVKYLDKSSYTESGTPTQGKDQDQALDYAKLVNQEENQQREKEQRSKHRHVAIVLKKQVKKEVDEGNKGKQEAKDSRRNKKGFRRRLRWNTRLPDHSDSSNKSIWNSTDNDKTESENDSDDGYESDKSDHEDDNDDSDKDSNKYSDTKEDQTIDFVIRPPDKEPKQPKPEPRPHSPSVTTTSLEDVSRDFTELESKEKLYDMMFESGSSISHQAHQELYDALRESIRVKKIEARYGTVLSYQKKQSHDDQDPLKNRKGKNKKKRCNDTSRPSSKKGKAQEYTSNLNKFIDADETRHQQEKEHECHLALTDKIDWAKPKGNRFHDDLSKALPLVGPPEKKYALLLSKINDARYEQGGIEEMILNLWSSSFKKHNRDAELGIHHWDEHNQCLYKGNIRQKSRHIVYSNLNIISCQSICHIPSRQKHEA